MLPVEEIEKFGGHTSVKFGIWMKDQANIVTYRFEGLPLAIVQPLR
jgi:hypothetical protein